MSDQSRSSQSRSLPDRPSLRFLKIEARERLAAGQFATLGEAQRAIAREHGQPSWAALKRLIESQAQSQTQSQAQSQNQSHPDSHALGQVRWVISRFAGADGPGWAAPQEPELAEHLEPRYLDQIGGQLVSTLSGRPHLLREELEVVAASPLAVRALAGGMRIEATTAAQPPHRLTMLRIYPAGGKVADARVADPPGQASGPVPGPVPRIAEAAVTELGLAGLVLAGSGWAVARGWASLESGEALRPGHRFPACSVTKLITATAVLRLAADGRVTLDDPANRYLDRVRLADDAVTVRELLSHTGGVGGPDESFAEVAPEPPTVTGAVLPCPGVRGEFRYSSAGYAALGALISAVTGSDYADAATRLVLAPLGMTSSSFPDSWPDAGPEAVTGYQLDADDGRFTATAGLVSTMPAADGMWSTAGDLARFGAGWRSLLPANLVREALTPHADRAPAGRQVGLGWILNTSLEVAGHPGAGPGASVALATQLTSEPVGSPHDAPVAVALTSRKVPVWPVAVRVLRAIA